MEETKAQAAAGKSLHLFQGSQGEKATTELAADKGQNLRQLGLLSRPRLRHNMGIDLGSRVTLLMDGLSGAALCMGSRSAA